MQIIASVEVKSVCYTKVRSISKCRLIKCSSQKIITYSVQYILGINQALEYVTEIDASYSKLV